MENLNFKVSSGLKDIIGQDLITDDYIAIYELVKNAFDAYARNVNIRITSNQVLISDDGKGMSYQDLLKKWLFVAYSAKKEGTEDSELSSSESNREDDYRSKIEKKRYFAGAKGIGRFSCDRLGKILTLYSKTQGEKKIHKLVINWQDFEINASNGFDKINVKYESLVISDFRKECSADLRDHGTVLVIGSLREAWDHQKIVGLRKSLTKLINPFEDNTNPRSANSFKIFIEAPEYLKRDQETDNSNFHANGEVKNSILEVINIKSTSINVVIKKDVIRTTVYDRGVLIYELEEKNIDFKELEDVEINLYYLNQAAKNNFTRNMAMNQKDFGSVFLFKNGFRIYPFGEPGDDKLKIDDRKQQGYNRFLGTRDLIGIIEIRGDEEGRRFKESSSRDGGFIITPAYNQLLDAFKNSALIPLERYVVGILWVLPGKDDFYEAKREADRKSSEPLLIQEIHVKASLADLLNNLARGKDGAKIINYDPKILSITNKDSALNNIDYLEKILSFASKQDDKSIIRNIEATKSHLAALQKRIETEKNLREIAEKRRLDEERRRRDAERRAKEAEELAKAERLANTLLKSTIAPGLEEIVHLHHIVGITAGTIDIIAKKVVRLAKKSPTIESEKVLDFIGRIIFENNKIHATTKFATKANFVMNSEEIKADLARYISDYVNNVISVLYDQQIKVSVVDLVEKSEATVFRPIEISMIIDNLISNSIKSGSTSISIKISKPSNANLAVVFTDNGKGIPDESFEHIFKFGYTTTKGSGLGLHHIQSILNKMGGDIKATPNLPKGAQFTLTF